MYIKICTKFALALSKTGLWCNGNTTVFGAVFLGSSPSRPTINPALAGFFVLMLDEKFIPNLFREVLVDQQKNPLNLRGFFDLYNVCEIIF